MTWMKTWGSTTEVLLVLVVALTASGCLYSREIQQTRREIQRANPELELDRTFSASVGPVGIRLARWITARVDDEDAQRASRYLRSVRRVKIGVFESNGEGSLAGISELRRFERNGWELAVYARDYRDDGDSDDDDDYDDGGDVWIYYRERGDTVTDLYAVVLSDEDLVIARVKGNLSELLAEAMREYGPEASTEEVTRSEAPRLD